MQCRAGSELSDVRRASYCGECESCVLNSGCLSGLSALMVNIFVYRMQLHTDMCCGQTNALDIVFRTAFRQIG